MRTLTEELGKRIEGPEGVGTPQEDRQSQLTWTVEGFQRLSQQPKGIHGLDLGLCSYVADVQLGLQVGPPQLEWGLTLKLLPV